MEDIIHKYIPNFDYGKRRQSPVTLIGNSGYFGPVKNIEERFITDMKKVDIIDAWKSHDTLFRQAGGKFNQIIDVIAEELPLDVYKVPYHTRI